MAWLAHMRTANMNVATLTDSSCLRPGHRYYVQSYEQSYERVRNVGEMTESGETSTCMYWQAIILMLQQMSEAPELSSNTNIQFRSCPALVNTRNRLLLQGNIRSAVSTSVDVQQPFLVCCSITVEGCNVVSRFFSSGLVLKTQKIKAPSFTCC